MTWNAAFRWALYWASVTARKHRVVGYRTHHGWAYYVSTGTK